MIQENINENYLKVFLDNLRQEDFEEISIFKQSELIDEILNVSNNPLNKTYFLTTSNFMPLALGGACSVKNNKYKIAKVWLLVTKSAAFTRKDIFRYVLNKIDLFKTEYDVLFNFIYKSNFKSLKWLQKAGFKVLNFNNDYKIFYFIKGDKEFDLRYFTS